MPKGKSDPRKVAPKKLLRELKKIAEENGVLFVGMTGSGHYRFLKGAREIIASSSPKCPDSEKKYFRRDCGRA
jgi:hypothetical protein